MKKKERESWDNRVKRGSPVEEKRVQTLGPGDGSWRPRSKAGDKDPPSSRGERKGRELRAM